MPKYKEFIREILGDRVVAYYPSLAHRFGVKSAILLSQLFHYASLQENPEDWFHIKIETITNHTGLSRKEQGAARKILVQWGVLRVKRKGMPRKNLYLVDLDALVLAVSEDKKLPEPSSQESPKGNHKGDPKGPTREAQRDPCIKESFKESVKEVSQSNDRGKRKIKKKNRQRDPLFDAICEVCKVDPKTTGASVGKIKQTLLAAGYTADDVHTFGKWWRSDSWRRSKGPPSIWKLKERIGMVRMPPEESDSAAPYFPEEAIVQ